MRRAVPAGDPAAETDECLVLRDEPDVAPRARRYVAARLRAAGLDAVVPDAELVATELVTNALLHAGAPVEVRAYARDGLARVEVSDPSRTPPVRGRASTESMTGRGLALVSYLASRWGVDPSPRGKVVWCELGGPMEPRSAGDDDAESLLAQWSPDEEDSGRFTVSLGDVPTELLLAAKAHVDNLVREFTLAASGAASGSTPAVPAPLAELIETVVNRFAEPRQAIKRQALSAAARGEPRTRLTLHLSPESVEAGEEYLAALDEADSYARAARLLTLETPPQHKVFRRWYVEALLEQLRAASAAMAAPPVVSFEQRLLDELGSVAEAQRAGERAARLHTVTAALAGAQTPEEVAKVALTEAVDALGASGGGLMVPAGDHLVVPGAVGYDASLLERLNSERGDEELPAASALRSGEPVWLESVRERDLRFPELVDLEPTTISVCAVPLTISGKVIGALRFSFERAHLFDEDERRFVLAVAAAAAQALERTQLQSEQRAIAERLVLERARAEAAAASTARLQSLTAALVPAVTVDDVVRTITDVGVGAVGAAAGGVCLVCAEGREVAVAGSAGYTPEQVRAVTRLPVEASTPVTDVVRSGAPLVFRDAESFAAAYPDVAALHDFASRAFLPVATGERVLGVLSMSFAEPRAFDAAEVELFTTIARQCAQALDRARLLVVERQARERTAFLADATELLTSSLEPPATLRHLTDLLVPRLADWVAVYLADAAGGATVGRVAHRDAGRAAILQRSMEGRGPLYAGAGGVGEVLATGRSVLHRGIPAELRERVVALGEALGPAADEASAMVVPLTARGRVVGAIALVRNHGPAYAEADLRLVEDVAARAAVAVDNAQSYAAERDAALTLQRSLLPQQPPQVPGIALAWRYLPGAAGARVGGDWYDVLSLDDGRLGLFIGDVMGRGLQAAAIMGQLRATARAYAGVRQRPEEVLGQLDAAVVRLEQAQITTCLYAVLEPETGRLTVASAGHLPPLIVPADGPPAYLPVEPGAPLGTGIGGFPEITVTLPEDAMLVLFTDGLVEDRARPLDDGLEALARVAATATDGPEDFCEQALSELVRDVRYADDTAMLVVKRLPGASG